MGELTLRDDQKATLVFGIRQKKVLLLDEPGCGKTPPVCVKIYERHTRGFRTAWIMPKSLMEKNQRELTKFTPLTVEQCPIVDGTPAQVDRILRDPRAVCFIMGPDRFKLSCDKLPKNTIGFDVDEYHKCYQGARSKKVEAWIRYASKKDSEWYVMTATFVNGRLDTCWPAIHALDPRYYPFGLDDFMHTHAILDEYDRPIGWREHGKLSKIISKHGLRRLFKDIFGHQHIVFQVEDVNLSYTQRSHFDELETTASLDLDKYMVDGTLPGVATIRCRQIMEHPNRFPHPEGLGTIDLLPEGEICGKEERLREHIQDHVDSGKPLVIFAVMVPQQERIAEICREMGLRTALLNGNTSPPRRAKFDKDFVAGHLDCLVCSIEIAGFGYNWQFWGPKKIEVEHAIFASLGYLDGDFIQAVKRFIRENRSTPLRITILAYLNSIDQKIFKINERKSIDANKVDPSRPILNFSDGGVHMKM